ncbi:unnamed protein product [Lactuca virosa]|uniref:F-box associated beta-propeller type 1 domain-containing protein n=1 Tax=Lactuca virosa TaxID=75947 RepID=A0AAU9PH66_9ASTR|nr:unnamed protein product [Lactuca virosa]
MVAIRSTRKPYKFSTIDCERPKDGFTAGRPFPFKVGPSQCIRILTSVHGLVCVGILKSVPFNVISNAEYCDLILWNPATDEYKTLSKPLAFSHNDCYNTHESLFGLYHSSWDDDYKLLRVTWHPKVYIYSLKSDSWRKVESDIQRTRLHYFSQYIWGPSVSLNENLYFLEHVGYTYSIMRFNTKTETLKVIATPFSENQRTSWLSFTILRDGCIHLWVNTVINPVPLSSENQLWRMEGDGIWTKLENSTMILCDYPIQYHHRLHLMRNGNLLTYDRGCVYQLDMKTHNKDLCSYTTKTMRVWPGGKYIETMVSPNQYANK